VPTHALLTTALSFVFAPMALDGCNDDNELFPKSLA
jgi:hypothetical protein